MSGQGGAGGAIGTAMTSPDDLRLGRPLRVALALALGLTLAVGAVEVREATGSDPARPEIVDFHPFHIAGRLALAGRFTEAYDLRRMGALQRAEGGGRDVFMPFVYPPSFGLMMAPLALLPVAPAFLLFGAATLALYLAVLRRLAGPWFALAALVSAPAAVIDLRLGQNGLLTGGLAGLAALLSLRGRGALAGAAAGLLGFKPQAAAGLALALAIRRDARAALATAAVAALLAGLAAAWFGLDAYAAWRGAAAAMGRLMTPDAFPLHRAVSAYACLVSLGAPPAAAMAAQAGVALAALAVAATAPRRGADAATAAGLCLMSTAFVSPYLFDYDLPAFCAGLALALPALAAALPPRRLGALLAAAALGGSLGLALNGLGGPLPSLGFPALLACFGGAALALRRPAPEPALTAAAPSAVAAP